MWAGPVRAEFDVPDHYRLVCGISVGYASDHPLYLKAKRDFEGLFVDDPRDFRIQAPRRHPRSTTPWLNTTKPPPTPRRQRSC